MHDDNQLIELGTRDTWGGRSVFGLLPQDRLQHTWLIGKSGTGKSTLLKNLAIQALEAGEGFALLDPHGDVVESILNSVPPWRTDHVVYMDPAQLDHAIGLNPLAAVSADRRHLVVDGIVGSLRGVWGESWGVRMEYVLSNVLFALLECENVSLLAAPRMLVDDRYRDWVVKHVTDQAVRQFWTREWTSWDARFRAEVVSPIQNKLGKLLLSVPLRNSLSQVSPKIDARFMMDHKRVLLANLSKGRLGADNSNLLGSLLVTQFQLAAMSRADIPEEQRTPFTLLVDEHHNFTSDRLADILSEARKYKLATVLAGQYLSQATVHVRDAVFGNVGTLISFRVGETDAAVLAREFGGGFTGNHFSDLDNYQVCVKLLERGIQREPFVGKTFPPLGNIYGRGDIVRRRSREKYAVPRTVVEDKIGRWMR